MGASFSTLAESTPTMYTVISWIAIGGAVALYFWFSQGKTKTSKNIKTIAQKTISKQVSKQVSQKEKEPREKVKGKKQQQPVSEPATKETGKAGKISQQPPKQAPKQAPKHTQKPTPENAPTSTTKKSMHNESSDEGIDNQEFARLFSGVQQGTKLQGSQKSEERQKSVKQSRAREVDMKNASQNIAISALSVPSALSALSASSGASSNADADADDDASPVTSPPSKAVVEAGDVADMLEHTQNDAPPVLRLTDTDKVKQRPKTSKVPEKMETKKQRQHRKRADAAKAQREKDEQERKKLMETQRRTARIAEGRAAKDGLQFPAAPVQPSVWKKSNGLNGAADRPSSNDDPNGDVLPVQPLDTFDANKSAVAAAKTSVAASSASQSTSKGNWLGVLPSEEEQMEMLREEEWSIVGTKKSKKNNRAESTGESDAASASDNFQKIPTISAVKSETQPRIAPANGMNTKSRFTQQSSFAALSHENSNIEEEWDV